MRVNINFHIIVLFYEGEEDDHRSELKGKIMSLNCLNEKLNTIQENNPTMVGGYYTDLQNSNNEAIAFYSEQIEKFDNGKPYRLDINDEHARKYRYRRSNIHARSSSGINEQR